MGDATHIVPFIINGEDYRPGKTFDVVSPATGKVTHKCGSASVDDAKRAVDAASAAFPKWRKVPAQEKRDIFLKAADIMARRKDELVKYMVDETGAAEIWANFNIGTTVDMLKDIAGRVAAIESTFIQTKEPDVSSIILREPYGVVLSIAPWNAPYILGARSVAFPIAAGNTVVFKASELSPRTLWAIGSIFQEAGLPNGVLNTISHEPAAAIQITNALITDPRVRKINFTGSTNVGRAIGKLAGEHLKPVVLELGGKAPAIVWEDANLDVAARECAKGAFLNSGQICMSTERILVHKNIKKDFHAKFTEWIEKIFPSSGPAPVLINATGVEKNKKLIADAKSKGADISFGNPDAEEGFKTFFRPVVIDKVTPEMDVYSTESFGPTVSLIEIDSEEEAVRIANDTEYGLSSALFTEDLRRGLRIARQIETGAVHINSMSPHDEPMLPHGGTKASGIGRFNSTAGIAEWLWTKNITFNEGESK